jgi:hypothetical protein
MPSNHNGEIPKTATDETTPVVIDGEGKRLIELYKYSLKHHYIPPIQLGSKWEEFAEKIVISAEYLGLPDKSLGRYYFEKYQKYLTKKNPIASVLEISKPDKPLINNTDDIEEGELVS